MCTYCVLCKWCARRAHVWMDGFKIFIFILFYVFIFYFKLCLGDNVFHSQRRCSPFMHGVWSHSTEDNAARPRRTPRLPRWHGLCPNSEYATQFEVADIIGLCKVMSQFTGNQNVLKVWPWNAYSFLANFCMAGRLCLFTYPTMLCILLLLLFQTQLYWPDTGIYRQHKFHGVLICLLTYFIIQRHVC